MNYFITYAIYVLILSVLMGISTWKMFKKMGYSPLMAFIPFYNYFIILKETEHSKWWAILSYLPIIGPIVMTVFHLFLMKKMGKNSLMDKLLTIFLPFVYMAYVNYTQKLEIEKEEEFLLPGEELADKKKDTFLGSITFAIVFATIIHTFVTQPFGIPTGSMEKTLLVGDFLFVNKLNYGFRMPMRPLALPFLQGTIMDTGEKGNPKDDPKSYVDAVDLPYFRLPGWEKVKRNDIVVFNYPEDSVHTAIDRKDPYVKRCVAAAGDVIAFKKGELFINGKPEKRMGDAQVQHAYTVKTENQLNVPALYEKYGFLPVMESQTENGFEYDFQGLTDEMTKRIGELPEVITIQEKIEEEGKAEISKYPVLMNDKMVDDGTGHALLSNKINTSASIFPLNKPWNQDWYGPLQVPKKGDVITLTKESLPTYKRIIETYEGNTFAERDGQYFINGKPANKYTIKYDYYMMIGDNRDASLDSRFFGFVPETHIVGKPMFTWMSIEGLFDNSGSSYQANGKKIRWDRMFKVTNTGEKDKTSYWWIAVGILVIFFGWDFFKKILNKDKEE